MKCIYYSRADIKVVKYFFIYPSKYEMCKMKVVELLFSFKMTNEWLS